jgi:ACS family hexuronate transporter-like MFS transporter
MTTRIKGLRWWMIGLFMIGTVLSYLTRASLAVAAPTILGELEITTEQYGWITGVFQFGLMLSPISGYVLDTIGLKVGLAIFAGGWAIITMAHGLANNWQTFAGLRALMGFAESTAHPSGMKLVSEWFPAKERGLGGGIYNVGASLGSMLAPPLIVWAILVYNWRMAFILAGAVAVVWVILWLVFYQPPQRHPALTPEERHYIASGQEAHLLSDGKRPSMIKLLRQRNFWGIALPRFLADPTWGTLALWVPLYLSTARGFDLKQIALFAWLPFVAADLGSMFGPIVVLWLQKHGVGLINARRGAFTLGALLMMGMMFVGRVDSPYSAIALLCLGGFAHQTLSVTVITMASDLYKRNEVGTVAGLAGTCGNAGVLVFSLLLGSLVTTIGYDPFFYALGVLDLVGAVVLWTLVRERAAPLTVVQGPFTVTGT